jgi:Xaa-Pro aminopeptidase
MLRRANDANRAMYARAREIVGPGINELDLYNELHAVAVRELGETLTYFGQDFRANARGGLPRDRQVQAGELMILDLGVGFRGYYSDNARTLAVGGAPSDAQQRAWRHVAEVFPLVESKVRPGVSCRGLFDEVQALLDRNAPWVFNHHLGHGVGLAPQEGPHLNPLWDDVFEEGEFFTVEPGLYHDALRHGVRLEENYLVTADGVQKLTDYPLEL